MTQQARHARKGTMQPFDFEAAVAEAYEQFPEARQHIFFIDVNRHKFIHTDPVIRPQLIALVNGNKELRDTLNTQIWKHKRNRTSSVMERGTKKNMGYWTFLYLEKDMQSALGLKHDLDQNMQLVFDHEFAHALIKQAHGAKLMSESTADVYAAIRHFQRYGTETGTIEKLVKRRAALGFINRDAEHFTSPALEALLGLKDQIDFKQLSPQETVRLAEIVAKTGAMKEDSIRTLSRHFNKLAKPMRDPKTDYPLRVLFRMVDKARSPDLKKWGTVALKAFLDKDIKLDTAKKLDTPYWNKARARLGLA